MSVETDSATRRIEAAFRVLGVTGAMHAVDLTSGREVGVRADQPVVLASVFKVALVVALHREHERGALDLTEAVDVPAARTAGATGLAAMRDPVRMSLRDLAYLAIAVSDNAAADVLFDVVGAAAVQRLLADLSLTSTRIPQLCRDMAAALLDDVGAQDPAEVPARLRADPGLLGRLSVRDPRTTNASTAREMTALLTAIWEDRVVSPQSCAEVRHLMGLQVWPHRLASGFPEDGFGVAGKTGTLPGVRNEIGVVQRRDGSQVAVAVFTVSDSAAPALPQVDRLIGTSARIAVDALGER